MSWIVKKGAVPRIEYYHALKNGLHRWGPDDAIAKQFLDREEVRVEFNFSDNELKDSGFVLEEVYLE